MKALSLILLLVLSVPLCAQSVLDTLHLSPDSCVAMALRNQVAVKNAALHGRDNFEDAVKKIGK